MASWRLPLTAALALMFLLTGYALDLELTPQSVWSRIGEKAVLSCRAKDCPSPTIKWTVGFDRPIGEVSNQGSVSTLTIDPVTVQNEQLYRCTAKCEGKTKWKDVTLNVYSLPEAVTLETVGSLQVGRKGAVKCVVPDVYPVDLTVEWVNETGVMNTQRVNEYTREKKKVTVTYELTPELRHSGQNLVCRIRLRNEKLQVEGTLTLDIHYPPRKINISAEPSLTVRRGQNASLTCTADGNPPVRIVWSRSSADGWSVIAENQTAYQFLPTRIENSGTYRCEAKNELGKIATEVEFCVQGRPSDTRLSVTPSAVREGDNVTISCTTHSNPPAHLVLTRNSTSGWMELKSENGIFSISAVQPDDGGWYQCEASNDLGRQIIHTELNVQYLRKTLSISAKPSLTVREGQNASLTCSANSSSPVTIVWSKLSAEGWSVIAEDQAALQLSQARIENSGIYRCEAKNELGKIATEEEFHVEGCPSDTRLSVTPSAVREGDNVTISCTTHSNPPAHLVLRRNSTSGWMELKSENGIFSISAVQLDDGGWYQCEASNDLGRQIIHTELNIQERDVVVEAKSPVGVIAPAFIGAAVGSVGLVFSGLYYVYRRINLKNSYQMSNDIL
ncbi:vascular cell adhesion protein 1-like [Mobula hypostoma]|uniref:vascular cell adhesion protein 1-like n=1 Tax=Mobula hypostoma TaxID=723540 RepID=UPI002FC2C69C